jgi:GNAT superfamily N-acetyltransferase
VDTGEVIRPARRDDLTTLREVERAAGAAFWDLGMDAVAEDEPPPLEELVGFQEDGRAWVATDDGRPFAYLLVEVVDGGAHIEQMPVHPDHARQGLGRALLDTAAVWAGERGLAALTLTTYADVPWKAPYYERLGFVMVPDDEATSGIRRILRDEEARGLARWPRVTMLRPFQSHHSV